MTPASASPAEPNAAASLYYCATVRGAVWRRDGLFRRVGASTTMAGCPARPATLGFQLSIESANVC
jgi:hypothetical protein